MLNRRVVAAAPASRPRIATLGPPVAAGLVLGGLVLGGLAGCSGDGDAKPGTTTPVVATPGLETATPNAGTTPKDPVKIGEPGTLNPDVAVRISKVTAVRLTGNGPGETSGPGARVSVEVSNTSGGAVDLGQIAVTASYAKGTPATPITSSGPAGLTGSLKPGKSATGVYQYRVPAAAVKTLSIEVSAGDSPYVLTFVS